MLLSGTGKHPHSFRNVQEGGDEDVWRAEKLWMWRRKLDIFITYLPKLVKRSVK